MTPEHFLKQLSTVDERHPVTVFIQNHSSKTHVVRIFDPHGDDLQARGFDPDFEKGAIEISHDLGGTRKPQFPVPYDKICALIQDNPKEVGLVYLTVYDIEKEEEIEQFFKNFSCHVQRIAKTGMATGGFENEHAISFPSSREDHRFQNTSPAFIRFLLDGETCLFMPLFPGNCTIRIDLCYLLAL